MQHTLQYLLITLPILERLHKCKPLHDRWWALKVQAKHRCAAFLLDPLLVSVLMHVEPGVAQLLTWLHLNHVLKCLIWLT